MCETYFIKATIAIQVMNANLMISIIPCSDFIVPENPKKAIAFPVEFTSPSNSPKIARIIELVDGKKDFNAEKIKEHISSLIAIAAQQKKVELRLEYVEECSEMKIVGFVFPAL